MSGDRRLAARELVVGHRHGRRAVEVVGGLDLELRGGELVCLLGPNGAGKTTLMRTLAGLLPPLAGRVELGGRDLRRLGRRRVARELAAVLTERAATGLLTARQVVELGRHPHTGWSGRLSVQDRKRVDHALERVGAVPLADRPVGELSDGERQKVMLARALAQEPSVLVLDEVTAFLDLPNRVEILDLLRRQAREEGAAVLMSTHDLDQALREADRLWLLGRDGRFRAGVPEDLVLGGAFEAVFAEEGLRFDRRSGTFHRDRPAGPGVEVVGSGVVAGWVTRALERSGYRVAPGDGPALRVEVAGSDGGEGLRLVLHRPGEAGAEHDSLEGLLAAVAGGRRGKEEPWPACGST